MHATRLSSCIAAFGPVALVAVAASGCSSASASTSGASAVGSATATATVSPSATGVAARLLTPKDLQGAWSVNVTPSNAPTAQTDCPLFNAPLWNASLPEHGESDLSQGLSPYLVETVADGTSAQVDKAWQALADNLSHCTTYTHTGSAGSSTLAITKAKLPAYGDSSYAFTLDVTITGGVHASGNVVAARAGNSVVVVYIAGIDGVSKSVVEDVVSAAVAKART
jgi:hypothetical protein